MADYNKRFEALHKVVVELEPSMALYACYFRDDGIRKLLAIVSSSGISVTQRDRSPGFFAGIVSVCNGEAPEDYACPDPSEVHSRAQHHPSPQPGTQQRDQFILEGIWVDAETAH